MNADPFAWASELPTKAKRGVYPLRRGFPPSQVIQSTPEDKLAAARGVDPRASKPRPQVLGHTITQYAMAEIKQEVSGGGGGGGGADAGGSGSRSTEVYLTDRMVELSKPKVRKRDKPVDLREELHKRYEAALLAPPVEEGTRLFELSKGTYRALPGVIE